MSYRVLSAKHSPAGDRAVWWGPGRCGYYTELELAGQYSLAEALDICYPGHPKAPPASFAVHGVEVDGLSSMSWEAACARFIPDGQPVQQRAGRAVIVIGEAP